MATVVLTVAGGLIGGPVGAAIGGMLGNAVDREVLFRPKGREGPRLSDLRVQTSSYGTQIPKIFGTMRVAGSVIWATELQEHRSSQGGGKGRPGTTSYSYTASFAVALSGRAITGVGRIWADGKLLRGAAGDWKAKTGFRLHLGSEEQVADPLIASAEGIGMAPAHRGMAYAVFEDLELADFGNRIPSLSFEVIGDAGAMPVGTILREVSSGDLSAEASDATLMGFAASGGSVRAVVETVAGAAGGWFRDDGEKLILAAGDGASLGVEDAGASDRTRGGARMVRAMAAADSAPKSLSVSHYDPGRDYQSGVQRAVRGGAGTREARLELPAAVSPVEAKRIAEAAVVRMDAERERRTVTLPWNALHLRPGDRVTIDGSGGLWRVDRWMLEAMVVTLECVPIAGVSVASGASGGAGVVTPDLRLGETVFHAFELPLLGDVASVPRIGIVAAGTGPAWRGASILLSTDGQASWLPMGSSAAPAVLGTVVVPPGHASATIEDRVNGLIVSLAHAGMTLNDADPAALRSGANLAMVGGELLQFGKAEQLSPTLWQLRELWRGRRGTESEIGMQVAGDGFAMVSPEDMAVRDVPAAAIGGTISVLLEGVTDAEPEARAVPILGRSLAPPSPVHLRFERGGDGAARISWVRRSRSGWDWIDGTDVPLGEESERYRVTLTKADGAVRVEETVVPWITVNANDGAEAVSVSVVQIGSHAVSMPAVLMMEAVGEG